MIDEKMTERMVACGWVAAGIYGLVTLVLSLFGGFGLTHLNLIDAAILLALAYGIYRRSRVCAVLALIYLVLDTYYFLSRLSLYNHAAYVPAKALAVVLIFAALYVLGIIGTFSHHARLRASRT